MYAYNNPQWMNYSRSFLKDGLEERQMWYFINIAKRGLTSGLI